MKKETLPEEIEDLSDFAEDGGPDEAAPVPANFPPVETPAGRFRRLKRNELVSHGDFVSNSGKGFEPWEGPSGFQAGSFVKAIYRRCEIPAILGDEAK